MLNFWTFVEQKLVDVSEVLGRPLGFWEADAFVGLYHTETRIKKNKLWKCCQSLAGARTVPHSVRGCFKT